MGKDKAGRWQYRYHPRFRQRQERRKFKKLVDFADALPRMRKRVARDIRAPGLGRDKVMACAIRVLSTCFMRPGSDEYARRHKHYGLTTILDRHVTVKGDLVTFDYPGKSGQQQHREIRDRSVARIVRQMRKLPGKELFRFLADDGAVVDVKREHLNAYIQDVMGPDFTAKDFRTWAGTLICACALARVAEDAPEVIAAAPKKEVRKRVVEAVKETAAELGNTPAVCKSSYIEPSVLSSFEKGEVVEKYFEKVEELVEHEKPTLAEPEKALKEPARGERRAGLSATPRGSAPGRADARPGGRPGPSGHDRPDRRLPGPRANVLGLARSPAPRCPGASRPTEASTGDQVQVPLREGDGDALLLEDPADLRPQLARHPAPDVGRGPDQKLEVERAVAEPGEEGQRLGELDHLGVRAGDLRAGASAPSPAACRRRRPRRCLRGAGDRTASS